MRLKVDYFLMWEQPRQSAADNNGRMSTMENETNRNRPGGCEIGEYALKAVNVLTVERGIIRHLSGLRVLPDYERIRYGVLEPDEVGVGLSLSRSFLNRDGSRICFEFSLWGRSIRFEEFREWFRKLPRKLPAHGCRIALPGGSVIALTRLDAPLGAVFETEYLFGIRVINGLLFLRAELDPLESGFHTDDAPSLKELIVEERKLPLLEFERTAAAYLRQRLGVPITVELDSLSPCGGAAARNCGSASAPPLRRPKRWPPVFRSSTRNFPIRPTPPSPCCRTPSPATTLHCFASIEKHGK